MMEHKLWLYSGEPTATELADRLDFWLSWSKNGIRDDRLKTRMVCPCCNSNQDTDWLRQEWYCCYQCMIWFTMNESLIDN